MVNYKALNTIRVLTFNVFENGYACCGSLHGSLKPRQYLDSSSQTFFPSPTEGLHRLSVSDIPSYWSVFGRNIFKRSDFGRIVVKPTDCCLSIFNASSLLEIQTSTFRERHSIVKTHKKEWIVFPFEKKSISLQLDYNFLRNAIKGHVLMNAFVKPTPRKV